MRWFSHRRSRVPRGPLPNKIPHVFVFFVPDDLDLWPLTLIFELGRDFCRMHLSLKFHHPTFNRSEVIVLTNKHTNKQTPLKTSTSLRYATPVGLTIQSTLHAVANLYPFNKFCENSLVTFWAILLTDRQTRFKTLPLPSCGGITKKA